MYKYIRLSGGSMLMVFMSVTTLVKQGWGGGGGGGGGEQNSRDPKCDITSRHGPLHQIVNQAYKLITDDALVKRLAQNSQVVYS